jgi:hypothetical protein
VRDAVLAVVCIKRWFAPNAEVSELEPYFDAVERLALHEIPDTWAPDTSPGPTLQYAMLGTVLFEPLTLALRRMAHVARTRAIIHGAATRKPLAPAHKATTKRTAKRKKR